MPELREHTYELAYNSACQLIGQGKYLEAERKLKIAEKLCRESLEDDAAAEEDIEEELGIIKLVFNSEQFIEGYCCGYIVPERPSITQ